PSNGVGDAAEVGGLQPHFRADHHVGRLEHLQDAAEIPFRLAFTVLPRRIEVVHAGRERARDGALLLARVAAHHQSADRAAAEAQPRQPEPGAPEWPHFHRDFPAYCAALIPSTLARPASLSRCSSTLLANSAGPSTVRIWPVSPSRLAMMGS